MPVDQLSLAQYFGFCVAEGFFVGALYVTLTLRRALGANGGSSGSLKLRLLTSVEDLLFFLIFTVIYLLTEYYFTSGKVRFLSLLGIAAGWWLFRVTLKSPYVFLCTKIWNIFMGLSRFVYRRLLSPFIRFASMFIKRVILRPFFALCCVLRSKRDLHKIERFGK